MNKPYMNKQNVTARTSFTLIAVYRVTTKSAEILFTDIYHKNFLSSKQQQLSPNYTQALVHIHVLQTFTRQSVMKVHERTISTGTISATWEGTWCAMVHRSESIQQASRIKEKVKHSKENSI
jgi:hypothetical protein